MSEETTDPLVRAVGAQVANALAELEPLFKPGVKLTFIARNTDVTDGSRDMVITNDELAKAIGAMELRQKAESR